MAGISSSDFAHAMCELADYFPVGIALVDESGSILFANPVAENIFKEAKIGAEEVVKWCVAKSAQTIKSSSQRYYRCWSRKLSPAPGTKERYLLVFSDVTAEHNLMNLLKTAKEEAEQALAVMLPDLRIAARLQSIVEYTDEYDPQTGKIRITSVISQGVYRHVINILKLIADTFNQGLMELPGMEKNSLVAAAIFHDLAKVQPVLKPGDMVNPREVFEPGYLHAFRSAALAEGIYKLSPDVVLLIKYHHHSEEELPPEFPPHLLPMYRFFRLIDGLSAAITRRGAKVKITVDATKVHVVENNPVPAYNQNLTMDLYTGKTIVQPIGL